MLGKTHLQREQRARKYAERRQALAVIGELVFAQHYVLVVGSSAANLHHLKAGGGLSVILVEDFPIGENAARTRCGLHAGRARENGREARELGNCLICGSRVAAQPRDTAASRSLLAPARRTLSRFTIESSRAEPQAPARNREDAGKRRGGHRARALAQKDDYGRTHERARELCANLETRLAA